MAVSALAWADVLIDKTSKPAEDDYDLNPASRCHPHRGPDRWRKCAVDAIVRAVWQSHHGPQLPDRL